MSSHSGDSPPNDPRPHPADGFHRNTHRGEPHNGKAEDVEQDARRRGAKRARRLSRRTHRHPEHASSRDRRTHRARDQDAPRHGGAAGDSADRAPRARARQGCGGARASVHPDPLRPHGEQVPPEPARRGDVDGYPPRGHRRLGRVAPSPDRAAAHPERVAAHPLNTSQREKRMTKTLLGLRAENYKRLELVSVEFPPGGGAVAIMGQNAAGKTSLLDALETTIAGRKMPKAAKPVRDGEETARVVATFDDIVVTRVFKANGSTQIKVTGADGKPVQRAEDLLSALYSHVALDPLAFSRLSDADQVDTLLPMIGFDPKPLDARYDDVFATRTIKNREVKALEARLAAFPPPTPGIPSERVSVADLMAELAEADAHNRKGDILRSVAEGFPRIEEDHEATVERLRAQLAEAEKALATVKEQRARAEATSAEFVPVETSSLRERIAAAEETNRAIAANEQRADIVTELKAAQTEAKRLTAELES